MRNLWPLTGLLIGVSFSAAAVEIDRRLPDEYETISGQGLALGNVATATQYGVAAVRANPALLAMDRSYSVSGGYNWPTMGRDFYQLGVVDSKSSNVAAGFTYTGFTDDYDATAAAFEKDSPVIRRANLAIAQNLGAISAGIGGQFVEAQSFEDPYAKERVRGTAINFGVAGLLSTRIRWGIAAENLANKKIADYAPRTFRAGVAYLLNSDMSVSLDVRQRDRVANLEQSAGVTDILGLKMNAADSADMTQEDKRYEQPERMAFVSFSGRVYDMVRLLGSYGQSVDGPSRQAVSGGIAIVSGNMSLCYAAARPYMSEQEAEQSINASIAINL